mgnify:CR=1 FL=1
MNSPCKYAQVLYDFEANYSDELPSNTGDILLILYKIDQEWVYAKSLINSNLSGIIPLSYLNFIDIPDEFVYNSSNITSNKTNLYLGISDFNFIQDGDLNFLKGLLCKFFFGLS